MKVTERAAFDGSGPTCVSRDKAGTAEIAREVRRMAGVAPSAVLDRDREAIRAVLASHGVDRAGVFGSVARGEDKPESDLDLIVAFRPGVRRDLVRIADDLARLTGLKVDVVDRDRVLERAHRTGVGYRILRDTVPL